MAHQATNIPWGVLASNLKWRRARKIGNGGLHFRFKPQQGKELHYFVEAFIRNVRNHAQTSRKKYPDTYEATHPDGIILDDAVVRKISPTIRLWLAQERERSLLQPSVDSTHGGPCPYTGDERCQYPIPCEERKASSFCREYRLNPCYRFFEDNGKGFFNQEIVKTLLLYGEMDAILRVCAIPNVCLREWWSVPPCYDLVGIISMAILHEYN